MAKPKDGVGIISSNQLFWFSV